MVTRTEHVGTIFSRLSALLRSGVVAWDERPLWYDVYAVFPPKYEPYVDRPPAEGGPVRSIIYPEDAVRARFYDEFGSPGMINLQNDKPSISRRFIEKYYEIAELNRDVTTDEKQLFEKTALALEEEGFLTRKATTAPPVEQDTQQIIGETPPTSADAAFRLAETAQAPSSETPPTTGPGHIPWAPPPKQQ